MNTAPSATDPTAPLELIEPPALTRYRFSVQTLLRTILLLFIALTLITEPPSTGVGFEWMIVGVYAVWLCGFALWRARLTGPIAMTASSLRAQKS